MGGCRCPLAPGRRRRLLSALASGSSPAVDLAELAATAAAITSRSRLWTTSRLAAVLDADRVGVVLDRRVLEVEPQRELLRFDSARGLGLATA